VGGGVTQAGMCGGRSTQFDQASQKWLCAGIRTSYFKLLGSFYVFLYIYKTFCNYSNISGACQSVTVCRIEECWYVCSFSEQDKENDIRNAQATQAVIQRRRRPKRRSTGVVNVDMDLCKFFLLIEFMKLYLFIHARHRWKMHTEFDKITWRT
jgi:hypothetical protein